MPSDQVHPDELRTVHLLRALPAEDIALLAGKAAVRTLSPGDMLFDRGDDGDSLFVVRSGRMKMVQRTDDGERVLDTIGPAGSFGELALLDPAPRSATAVAAAPTELIEIAKTDFDACADAHPEAMRRILGVVARDLTQAKEARTHALYEQQLETIMLLATLAEVDDKDTGMHVLRVSGYAERLGRAAGLSASDADLLEAASMLHDVGKIGIPKEIIRKPGRFEPYEYAFMQQHSVIGAKLLSIGRSELAQMGSRIARAHHERWDGNGYPDGLAGEDIPLEGRIVTICDVFDALMSKRPYKEAIPLDEVLEMLTGESGKHFDPELTELFLSEMEAILTVRTRYAPPVP